MLIAIEGTQGSGKSMQTQMLSAWLKGRAEEVTATGEPSRGKWGQMIKKAAGQPPMPPQQELQLHINDRKELCQVVIAPALTRNELVIVDKYYYTDTAYFAVRGFDMNEVLKLNHSFAPKPDLVFLIDMDPKAALERVSKGPPDLALLDQQVRMRAALRELAQNQPQFALINGAQDPRVAQESIRNRYTEWKNAKEPVAQTLPSLTQQEETGPNATCKACGALSERVALERTRKCEWCGAPWSP